MIFTPPPRFSECLLLRKSASTPAILLKSRFLTVAWMLKVRDLVLRSLSMASRRTWRLTWKMGGTALGCEWLGGST